MSLHADAIAKNRAAGVGTCRIDGNNPNVIPLRSIMRGQPIDQRALPRSGCASNPDDKRLSLCQEKFVCKSSSARGSWSSIAVIAREMARTSPARICSAQVSMGKGMIL